MATAFFMDMTGKKFKQLIGQAVISKFWFTLPDYCLKLKIKAKAL